MSRPLMSSRAETAVCCSLLSRILWYRIKMVLVNIGQNSGREQTRHCPPALVAASKLRADLGSRDGVRRYLLLENDAGGGGKQDRGVPGQTPVQFSRQFVRQVRGQRHAGPRDDDHVRERKDLAP